MKTSSLLGAVLFTTSVLSAQDDRDRTTPTGAIWDTSLTSTEVSNLVNQGWRLTDIEIEDSSPFSFAISAVHNSGSYAKAWWYAVGVTAAQLGSSLSANNARLIDLEPYDDNGTTRFVAIMISNTGADQKTWWWGYGMSSAQVNTSVSSNNARLTTLERYSIGGTGHFAVVMISNTGADYRNWGYLYSVTSAQINQNLAQYGNRIYGIERVGADSYDAILVPHASFGHWYYFELSGSALTELLQQNIGRLIDVERHVVQLGGVRYTAVLLDNANALERTARQAFFAALPNALGDYGFYLKEVNGPVLAQMRPDTVFEPASTMKTVYHAHAMWRVLNGVSLNMLINKPTSCGVAGRYQTLELTLSEMMENSDNMSTLAISNHFGLGNIEATAAALGMSSTHLNFTLGCSGPSPENELTLRDLGQLHERVANGYLGSRRTKFYELMAESLSFPTWGTEDLRTRIDAEALALGLPIGVRDAFKSALHIAYKPGGVAFGVYYFAEGGWMSVPFKNRAGAIAEREYVFGVFNYAFTANEISGRNVMSQAELEIVWDRVRAALHSWDNFVAGSFTSVGTGCAGSNGTPVHTASGTPEIGATIGYRIANAPAFAGTVLAIGFSNTTWNSLPLPLNLGFLGAPNCILRNDQVVTSLGIATITGARTFSLPLPSDPALIDLVYYTQYFVIDPLANSLGLTLTGSIRTELGGWL